MRARRTALVVAVAVAFSLSVVSAARADTPTLTTPGQPVVVENSPRLLKLTWEPSTWIGTPDSTAPIHYQVWAWQGPNVYQWLGESDTNSVTLTNLPTGTEYRVSIQTGTAAPSPATEIRTAYGRAKVSHLNLSGSPTDNQVHPALQVTNTGTEALDLSTVRVRYHLRTTIGEGRLVSVCDWAAIGCDTITHSMIFLPPPVAPPGGPSGPAPSAPPTIGTPAPSTPMPSPSRSRPPSPSPTMWPNETTPMPGWLELTFTGGSLAPGRSTGPIYLRMYKPSWTPHDERRDPSWRAADGRWYDNSRITLDIDGVREFGTP